MTMQFEFEHNFFLSRQRSRDTIQGLTGKYTTVTTTTTTRLLKDSCSSEHQPEVELQGKDEHTERILLEPELDQVAER